MSNRGIHQPPLRPVMYADCHTTPDGKTAYEHEIPQFGLGISNVTTVNANQQFSMHLTPAMLTSIRLEPTTADMRLAKRYANLE